MTLKFYKQNKQEVEVIQFFRLKWCLYPLLANPGQKGCTLESYIKPVTFLYTSMSSYD